MPLWSCITAQRVRSHGIHFSELTLGSRADIVRLGYSTSGKRLRARDKRSRLSILPGFPRSLYRYVELLEDCHWLCDQDSFDDCEDLRSDTDPELFDVAHLPPSALAAIEGDSFWCLSKLLDGIQDNYISQQPGIQRLVKRMSELVKRIDGM